jgi:hypothetical protein
VSLYSPEASYKGRRFKKQTLAVNFTRTHFYTYITVPLSLSSLIPVRRRTCCWSGDAPEAHRFRQRRTSYARGGQVRSRLSRDAQVPTTAEGKEKKIASDLLTLNGTCCWSGDAPEAHRFRQRRTSYARGGQVTSRLSRDAQVPTTAEYKYAIEIKLYSGYLKK